MKKSAQVTLTVVAAMGLACNRRPADPCQSATFSAETCEEAVRSGGYHWRGTWIPMMYPHPYPYYYDGYRSHLSRGGQVRPAPSGVYSRPGAAAPSAVPRGGFGSTGASHGVGA